MTPTEPVVYSDYRKRLLTGDILLAHGRSAEGKAISAVTRDVHTHATMIGYAGDDPYRVLMLGETREGNGARLIALSSEVKKWPGCYDVYRVRSPFYRPAEAWAFICRAGGATYSWPTIIRVGLRRKVCRFIPAIPNSDDPQYPRDCSGLVHAALRMSGVPPFCEYDADCVPGTLDSPLLTDYVCTLYWTQAQIDAIKVTT